MPPLDRSGMGRAVAQGKNFAADFLQRQRTVLDLVAADLLGAGHAAGGSREAVARPRRREGGCAPTRSARVSPDLDPDKTGMTGALCPRLGRILA